MKISESNAWNELDPLMDPEMVEFCKKLNMISGIQTLQSCSGHAAGETSKNGETYNSGNNGHLWVIAPLNNAQASRLAKFPSIERVSKIFWPSGETFWEICFDGKNRPGKLKKSLRAILNVMEELR